MSKRLQVLLPEEELRTVKQAARRQGTTVATWVRQAIRSGLQTQPTNSTKRKLSAMQRAMEHAFPAPPINEMLAEIDAVHRQPLPE